MHARSSPADRLVCFVFGGILRFHGPTIRTRSAPDLHPTIRTLSSPDLHICCRFIQCIWVQPTSMPSKPQNKRDTDIEKCYFSRTCAFLFVASFSHLAARRKSNTGAVSLLVRLQVASCATEKHGTSTLVRVQSSHWYGTVLVRGMFGSRTVPDAVWHNPYTQDCPSGILIHSIGRTCKYIIPCSYKIYTVFFFFFLQDLEEQKRTKIYTVSMNIYIPRNQTV